MMLEIGRVIADRYEITEKIGSGGMSIVYKAMDKTLNRPVSLKVLREEYSVDEEFRKRFIREARSVASLSHQNIVNVYDVGQEKEINYIVMEFIAGMTLKELINKRAPFSDQEVLGVAIQMTAALIHAHNSKIIHRDIKPQNVIVTGKGVIKVTDFGIARRADSDSITMGGSTTLGSVHYFSPEQAKGVKADPKSDLYSLGIVMFEMLTGELPFDADTAVSVALMQINEPLPDMLSLNPDVNPRVKRIVEKLTEKNPEYRYQSAEALLKDLRAIIANPEAALSFDSEPARTRITKSSTPSKTGTGDHPSLESDDDYDDEEEGYIRSRAGDEDYDDGGYPDYDDDDDDDDDYEEEAVPPKRGKSAPRDDYSRRGERGRYEDKERGRYDDKDRDRYDDKKKDHRDRNIIIAGVAAALLLIALFILLVLPNLLKNITPGSQTPDTYVKIPSLERKNFETLRAELDGLGVNLVKLGEAYSDEVPVGAVIEANYNEGDTVDPGTTVEAVVSLGRELYEVPKFTGYEYMKAQEVLRDKNIPLKLADDYEFSATYPFNVIFDQNPKEGEMVPAGTEVTIYISKGEEYAKFTMPKLIGKTLSNALDEIERLGLKAGNITYRHDEKAAEGIVTMQTPSEGKEIRAGNMVDLVVSDGPAPTATPEPGNETGETPTVTEEPGTTARPDITPLPHTTLDPYTSPTPSPAPTPTPKPAETAPPNVIPSNLPIVASSPTPTRAPYSPPPAQDTDTTPTPTQEPVVVPTQEPPVVLDNAQKTYSVTISDFTGESGEAKLEIIRVAAGDRKTEYLGTIYRSQLPLTLEFSASGTITYYVYINGILTSMKTINLD